jgi:hypothetical protein
MAAAGYLTTPRGQRSVYLHSRVDTGFGFSEPDYVFNSETNQDADAEYAGIIQATLNSYDAANGKTIDVDAGVGVTDQVLTYNPITDSYDIKPGQYVL